MTRFVRSFAPGKVLVVGSGTSGVQIGLDLAPSHTTSVAGRPTPRIPAVLLRHAGALFWWFISNVLTVRTPMGRKARGRVRTSGAPLLGLSASELDQAGVARLPRGAGVRDGRPVLDDRSSSGSPPAWSVGSAETPPSWPSTSAGPRRSSRCPQRCTPMDEQNAAVFRRVIEEGFNRGDFDAWGDRFPPSFQELRRVRPTALHRSRQKVNVP